MEIKAKFRGLQVELIELIVAGALHGDVQQQPVLLPAATARLHEARRDGPTPASPGNPIGHLDKKQDAEMDHQQHRSTQGSH